MTIFRSTPKHTEEITTLNTMGLWVEKIRSNYYIKHSKSPDLIMYIGLWQYHCLMSIQAGDRYSMHNKRFMDVLVVKVCEDDYLQIYEVK